jgi:hypothetical protein
MCRDLPSQQPQKQERPFLQWNVQVFSLKQPSSSFCMDTSFKPFPLIFVFGQSSKEVCGVMAQQKDLWVVDEYLRLSHIPSVCLSLDEKLFQKTIYSSELLSTRVLESEIISHVLLARAFRAPALETATSALLRNEQNIIFYRAHLSTIILPYDTQQLIATDNISKVAVCPGAHSPKARGHPQFL